MMSFPKLLVIVAVIFLVWSTVRWLNRPPMSARRRRPLGRGQVPPRVQPEDLVACPVCGAYVAQSARRCGRAACPRPR
jgi:hypothetical protein